MNKILTIVVPCYNSQEYLRRSVESILPGGEDIDLLIVDDGSVDATGRIAEEYASRHPSVVRVIHQENGGHGAAIMTGLQNAHGYYFKVVDSDDWLEEDALLKLLAALKQMVPGENAGSDQTPLSADFVITNYIYDHGPGGKKKRIQYRGTVPENRIFTWDEVGHFHIGSYFLMHAATFRTEFLRETRLYLPEHTFYVDNIYVYVPLARVKTLYYLNVDLYHYVIGRPDQSVNESVQLSRLDQQLRINKVMLSDVNIAEIQNKRQREYMLYYLEIVTAATCTFHLLTGKKEDENRIIEFLTEIREKYPDAFRYLTAHPGFRHPCRFILYWPRKFVLIYFRLGYRFSQKIFGFN